jgi:hypothetical protein
VQVVAVVVLTLVEQQELVAQAVAVMQLLVLAVQQEQQT